MTDRVVIDTDPGRDDAIALLLALASPEIEVLGVCAVAGNVPVALTTRNALAVCELAGRPDVPVFAGAARPLVRDPISAEAVHGATGLDVAGLPAPRAGPRPQEAADFIVETLRREPAGTVTLCVLGPMTNLALAFARAPDVATRVARIVAMGGSWSEGGNITPAAEFNILADPHAAQAVLHAGAPVVLHPLDVTHRSLARADRVGRFRALGTPAGRAAAALMADAEHPDVARFGADGVPLHDPHVIAWLLRPGIFRGRDVNVEVETGSALTLGQTVVDWWGVTGRPANVHFVREVDDDAFFALLEERIGRL